MLVATAALFRLVPGSLAPTEDQGYIIAIPLLQDAASLERTEAATEQLTEALLEHPAVTDVISFAGIDVLTFAFAHERGRGLGGARRNGTIATARTCRRGAVVGARVRRRARRSATR